MASFSTDRELKKVLAKAVVEGNCPFGICEQDWVYELLDVGIKTGFKAKKDKPHMARPVSGHSFKVSRSTLTPLVDHHCEDVIQRHLQQAKEHAAIRGCTQVSDGRSNIKNDSLLVHGVIAGSKFFLQGAHNAGESKKDAIYLAKVSKGYLDADDGLGDDTFCNVSDGAKACLNALDLLEAEEYLVPSRCQSHAVSLFVKTVATDVDPFPLTISKASKVIDFIRSLSRVNTILKKKTSGNSVLHFVPTLFGTHVIAVGRLLALQVAIQDLLSDSVFLAYKSSHTVKVQSDVFDPVEAIIRDVSSWDNIKFFHRIMLPAVKAMRLMDSSFIRAKDVIAIWENLESRLIVELQHPNFALVDVKIKKKVVEQYINSRTDAHRPVFDAAWVLDPANRQRVREIASGKYTKEDQQTWASRRDNTLQVLETIIKRKALLLQKQEFHKLMRASKDVKRVKVGAEELAPAKFVLDEAQHSSDWATEFAKVEKDFTDYICGIGGFLTASTSSLSSLSESFWIMAGCSLSFFAIRILNMAATISDVERLHKVYAGIHTPSRNRLTDCQVDRLALARIASRVLSLDPKPFISQLDNFATYSPEEEVALVEWAMVQSQAIRHLARTLQEPSLDGSFRLDPYEPELIASKKMANTSSLVSEQPLAVATEVDEPDNQTFEEIDVVEEVSITETESGLFFRSIPEGRQKRKVRLSSGMLARLHVWGLSTDVLDRT